VPRLQLPVMTRSVDVVFRAVPDTGDGKKTFEMSVSSETPALRMDYFQGQMIREVLSHKSSAIDKTLMKDGLPVLLNHDRYQHVGICEEMALRADGKLAGVARFSRTQAGRDVEMDVEDGIKKRVSLGYRPLKARRIPWDDDIPTYEITRWLPAEVTLTPVPIDAQVGVNRSDDRPTLDLEIEEDDPTPKERSMPPDEPTQTPTQPTPAPAPTPAAAPAPSAPQAVNRGQEAAEIVRMCANNGLAHRSAEFIEQGLTADQVSREILRSMSVTPVQPSPSISPVPGASPRDLSNYLYGRALDLGIRIREGGKVDGLEWEVHRELEKNYPGERKGGILMPWRLKSRALDTKTVGKGLEFVQDQPAEMIELLRPKTKIIALGAQLLTGLQGGPLPFMRQTGAMTAYWMTENPTNPVTRSDIASGIVMLSPKTLMCSGLLARQLMTQVNFDSETMVRNEITTAFSERFDHVAVHGTGAGGEPMGLYNIPGVLVEAIGGAVPSYTNVISMQAKVAAQNALGGTLGYLTEPLMAGKLKTVLEASAAGAAWIWKGRFDDGEMGGYRAEASNLVRADLGASSDESGLVFGNWNDMIIGLWGALEIVVDPYTLSEYGMVKITGFTMGDILTRHPQSFIKATGAKRA
jgi:hypothetical protein